MDSRLRMKLTIDKNGNLLPIDHTVYDEDIYDHILIDRLLDEHSNLVHMRTTIILNEDDYHLLTDIESFEIPSDGLYTFQRLYVPLKGHAGDSYYFDDGEFYDANDNVVCIEDVWENKSESMNIFWFDDLFFSIYNLIECFILQQKERLNEFFRNGCDSDCSKSWDSSNVDLLAAIIFVLEHYIHKRAFYEAQALLNKIETCNGLCKNVRNKLKGCGCNGKSN